MWKAVGSVRSGDDKSIRSNKSREQVRFEHFETKSIDHSRQDSKGNNSFCYDYFEKKRQNYRNMTFDERVKSQKSLRFVQNNKDDMFTSIRNVNLSQKGSINKNDFKQTESNNAKGTVKVTESNGAIIKNTQNKIKVLKKDQKRLKKILQQEMTEFKNIMLQLQDTIVHSNLTGTEKGQTKTQNQNQNDYDILKQIIAEANGMNSYFSELDLKKDAILANIGNNDK